MAERTGLEPATPGVTGRYSNRLNYRSATGVPRGIRTPVTAVKGRCPRPLDDGDRSLFGGGKRTRTADPLHAMQVLYQLSYTPTAKKLNYIASNLACQRLAERAGFEPASGDYPEHALQACGLNHSPTSPSSGSYFTTNPLRGNGVLIVLVAYPLRSPAHGAL